MSSKSTASGNTELYDKFVDAYLKAHPTEKRQTAVSTAQKLWKDLKAGKQVINVKAENLIVQWKAKAATITAKQMGFWAGFTKKAEESKLKSK